MNAYSTLSHIIRCPICQDLIGDEPKAMRMCGHTLCHNCYMIQSVRVQQMPCPVCRVNTYVGAYGAVGNNGPIPVNIMLKDVYQFVTENAALLSKECKFCKKTTGEFSCTDCLTKKEAEAVKKARPQYSYEYDNCSVLESVTKKYNLAKAKFIDDPKVEQIQVKELENDDPKVEKSAENPENGEETEECVIM